MHFNDTDDSSLPHIGVLVLEGLSQGFYEVLGDLADSDTAHSADSEGAEDRIPIFEGVLAEGVDSQNNEVWVGLGVVDNVQVDQLLEFQVFFLHVAHNLVRGRGYRGEERGYVLSEGHCTDDHLHCALLVLEFVAEQFLLEHVDISFLTHYFCAEDFPSIIYFYSYYSCPSGRSLSVLGLTQKIYGG